MASYSVAQAKDRLSALIEEAVAGKPVIITKHGREVVEIRSIAQAQPKPMSKEVLDQLRAQRARLPKSDMDSGTLMRLIRDEEI